MRGAAERLLADGGGRKSEGEYVFVDRRDVRGVEEFK